MHFRVENLGPIKSSNLELGDLTVVCGRNNTGKSYLTYSLFSFLTFMRGDIKHSPMDEDIREFVDTGKVVINLVKLAADYNKRLSNGNMLAFMKKLPDYLSLNEKALEETKLAFVVDIDELIKRVEDLVLRDGQFWFITKNNRILVKKKAGQATVECRLEFSQLSAVSGSSVESDGRPSKDVIIQQLQRLVSYLINRETSDAFIITCERTGAALFQNEFNIFRDLALKDEQNLESLQALRERFEFKGYPLPIRRDLDFVLRFNEVISRTSFIAKDHPEIIQVLESIIGGSYTVDTDLNRVRFLPSGASISLTLVESSSSVRSLSELNFYLKHVAKPGQILMIDEPELNLHPAAQRKMARLFVMLVNAGVKVFVTTHSDYIIRELNALIMLNGLSEKQKAPIFQEFGYTTNECMDFNRMKCYVVQNGEAVSMGGDEQGGFAVDSFDDTIHQFNRLYQEIMVSRT